MATLEDLKSRALDIIFTIHFTYANISKKFVDLAIAKSRVQDFLLHQRFVMSTLSHNLSQGILVAAYTQYRSYT